MLEENVIIENKIIQKFYDINLIPNLLLIGDNSIDKESHILNFIKKYYKNNKNYINNEILYLNIVIDRSIKRIREIIKKFISEVSNYDDDNKIILKFIIINNIETITFEIQYALRRIIEDNNKKIRFVLIGNNSQSIIQPLISRCLLIYFNNESLKSKKIKLEPYINNNNIDDDILKLYSTKFYLNNMTYFNKYYSEIVPGEKSSALASMIVKDKKKKVKINWDIFLEEKNVLDLYNKLNIFIENDTNYYVIINDFSDWILNNNNLKDVEKLKIFKLITLKFSKIINNGNIFLNIFSIFIFYLDLIKT